MKASSPPETIPGTSSGSVTLRNRVIPDAPRSLATRPARTNPSLTYYERMHERLRAAGLSAQDSARFLFAIDDYCISAALNTEVDVEINDRQDKFPLVTEAMETGRPTDHHEATLRLLLKGLIATVNIPAA